MENRQHAFGQTPYNGLDNIIFWLRKRQVTQHFKAKAGTIVDLGSAFDCRLLRALLEQSPALRGIAVDSAFDSRLANDQLQLIAADLNQPLTAISSASATTIITLAVLEHLTEPGIFLSTSFPTLRSG